jgi:hypothetical protein
MNWRCVSSNRVPVLQCKALSSNPIPTKKNVRMDVSLNWLGQTIPRVIVCDLGIFSLWPLGYDKNHFICTLKFQKGL